jgi:hypothetical protein
MEFRQPLRKNVAVFIQKTATAWVDHLSDIAKAIMLDVPAARPGRFREGAGGWRHRLQRKPALAFTIALTSKPGLSTQPFKI